jgi:hypothetical protein
VVALRRRPARRRPRGPVRRRHRPTEVVTLVAPTGSIGQGVLLLVGLGRF